MSTELKFKNTNSDKEKDNSHRVRREEWKKEKEFERDGIVVIVSKLPLRYPRYSIEIASRTQFGDQKIGRHFQVHVERNVGKSNISRIATRTLVQLINQAEEYIEKQDQENIDLKEYLEWKKNHKENHKENIESSVKSESITEDDNVVLIGKK